MINKVKSRLYVSLVDSSLEDTKIAVKEEVREEECSEWQPDRSHHPSVKEEQSEDQLIENQGTCFISLRCLKETCFISCLKETIMDLI